jgi:hypothetical protein
VPDSAWLIVSFVASFVGIGWLALSLDAHWSQAFGAAAPTPSTRRILRWSGATTLGTSLLACFAADHPTMAPLTWVMGVAVAAVVIAFVLAWRPRLLVLLVPFSPPRAS